MAGLWSQQWLRGQSQPFFGDFFTHFVGFRVGFCNPEQRCEGLAVGWDIWMSRVRWGHGDTADVPAMGSLGDGHVPAPGHGTVSAVPLQGRRTKDPIQCC